MKEKEEAKRKEEKQTEANAERDGTKPDKEWGGREKKHKSGECQLKTDENKGELSQKGEEKEKK